MAIRNPGAAAAGSPGPNLMKVALGCPPQFDPPVIKAGLDFGPADEDLDS